MILIPLFSFLAEMVLAVLAFVFLCVGVILLISGIISKTNELKASGIALLCCAAALGMWLFEMMGGFEKLFG